MAVSYTHLIRQMGDEVVRIGQLGCRNAFFIGGIQSSIADVIHYATGKEVEMCIRDREYLVQRDDKGEPALGQPRRDRRGAGTRLSSGAGR